MIRRRRHLLVVTLIVALTQASCSQLGSSGRGRGDDAERRSSGTTQRLDEVTRLTVNDEIRLRLTDLRIALKVTPEQTAILQAYENAVIQMLSDAGSDSGNTATGNALNQLDRRVIARQRRAAEMDQLWNAARKLYSMLTDEQKRVADRMLPGTVPTEALGLPAPARSGR